MVTRPFSPNGHFEVTIIARNAFGTYNVFILSEVNNYIYSSEWHFPSGFSNTRPLRFEWDEFNRLVVLEGGQPLGYWYWNASESKIAWDERSGRVGYDPGSRRGSNPKTASFLDY